MCRRSLFLAKFKDRWQLRLRAKESSKPILCRSKRESQMSKQTMTEDDKMNKPLLTPDDTLTTVDDSSMKKAQARVEIFLADDELNSSDSNGCASTGSKLVCPMTNEAEVTNDSILDDEEEELPARVVANNPFDNDNDGASSLFPNFNSPASPPNENSKASSPYNSIDRSTPSPISTQITTELLNSGVADNDVPPAPPFYTPDDTLTTLDDFSMKKGRVELLLDEDDDDDDDDDESSSDSNSSASHSDNLDCTTTYEAEATIDPTSSIDGSSNSREIMSSPIPKIHKANRIIPKILPQSPPTPYRNKKQPSSSSFSNSLNSSLQSTSYFPNKSNNNIASPEFVDYIRSTEKELDALLSELDVIIVSPKNSDTGSSSSGTIMNNLSENREIEQIDSKDNGSMTGIQRELSFGDSCRRRPLIRHQKKQTNNVQSHVYQRKNSRRKELKQPQPPTAKQVYVGRDMYFLVRAFLLSCFITTTLSIMLGSIYPASPLLEGRSHIIQRFHLGLAAFSFGIATSIRTIIAAPLLRLDDRLKSRGIYVRAITQILNVYNALADTMELCSHDVWEDTARHNGVLKSGSSLRYSFQQPPEIDLGMRVPCDVENVKVYSFQNNKDSIRHDNNSCRLRDVVTLELLTKYAAHHFDAEFNLSTHPLILRNLWPEESFDPDKNHRRLTLSGILNDPQLSNFILPNYFSDATKTGYSSLVPDSDATSLSKFVNNILTGQTPYAKIGTQSIIEEFPNLREEIIPRAIAKELFGWDPWLDELREKVLQYVTPAWKRIVKMIPPTTYYPIFIAGMAKSSADMHSRTDLHTEPIGNIAVQLHGTREWTLVPTKWSGLLRPTVSKHGRGKNIMIVIKFIHHSKFCILIFIYFVTTLAALRVPIFWLRSSHRIAH